MGTDAMKAIVLLISMLSMINITSSSYVIGQTALSYQNAVAYCEIIGGQLASTHSESDYYETKALCEDINSDCWIGLSDITSEGVWEWEDGTVTDYGFVNNDNTNPATGIFPWEDGEPNNFENIEDCIHLRAGLGFLWNDAPCTDEGYPICACGMYSFFKNRNNLQIMRSYTKRYWMYGYFIDAIWIYNALIFKINDHE